MSVRGGVLARIRPAAGPLLLGVFVAAAQLVPLTHLATHRNDHTHGPAGTEARRQRHGDDDAPVTRLATLADALARHGRRAKTAAPPTSSPGDHDHGPAGHAHEGAPRSPLPAHGSDSSAHLTLAILEGPPALYLPPPAGTLAPSVDAVERRHVPPPRCRPSARGPPALA